MRLLPLFALLVSAAWAQPELTVLYGHEDFRSAENMLREHIRKLRDSAESEREKTDSQRENAG